MKDYVRFSREMIQVRELFNDDAIHFDIALRLKTTETLYFYDSYDHILAGTHRCLIRSGDTLRLLAGQDGTELSVFDLENRDALVHRFSEQYPDGPFRDFLKNTFELKAVIPFFHSTVVSRDYVIKNSDGKIVCFCEVRSYDDVLRMIRLRGVKGYDLEFKRIKTILGKVFSKAGTNLLSLLIEHKGVPMYHPVDNAALLFSPDMPLRKAVGALIGEYLNTVRYYVPGVIDDIDTECLHQFRVTIRKIRSLLSIIKDVYPPGDTKRLNDTLKKIQQKTNRLRDLDVYLMEEDYFMNTIEEVYRDDLKPLFTGFRNERSRALQMVVAFLSSDEYKRDMAFLHQYIRDGDAVSATECSGDKTGDAVHHYVKQIYKKIVKKIGCITESTPDDRLHDLRIRCKKLRYLLEFFAPFLSEQKRTQLLKELKKVQTDLGDFNDYTVQHDSLEAIAGKLMDTPDRKSGELLALGMLIAKIDSRQREQRKKVITRIAGLTTKEFADLLHAVLFP